jgi:hypothetical protein
VLRLLEYRRYIIREISREASRLELGQANERFEA